MVFSLNKQVVPLSSAKSDDNGAYLTKGTVKKHYYYNNDVRVLECKTVHKSSTGSYYYNVREARQYKAKLVPEKDVYEVVRCYRQNKSNPGFSQTLATARKVTEKDIMPYYLVTYKWFDGKDHSSEFKMPRHGNATKPETFPYYRQDPNIFHEIDSMLENGLSTDKIYRQFSNKLPTTVSETVKCPKVIENRKFANSTSAATKTEFSEAESILKSLRTAGSLIKSVSFGADQYSTTNFTRKMLEDIYRFCVLGDSILTIDTTFEICDGLWLTDTTYANLALLDSRGKNPEFPGPSFWHFKKAREAYRRFAGELVIDDPKLAGIKKIGHDLDKALAQGKPFYLHFSITN